MGVSADSIEEIYTLLCQNPSTGAVPSDISTQINASAPDHATHFTRFSDGYDIRDAGEGDRLVFVEYEGHNPPGSFGHPTDTQGTFRVNIQIRYDVGDHDDVTQQIMADDFHLIRKILGRDSSRPTGNMGYRVTGSGKEEIGEKDAYLLSIATDVIVIGST